VWEGYVNLCVQAAERALDVPPNGYTAYQRNSLTDIFSSMTATHRSIRLLVKLGDGKPESVDEDVLHEVLGLAGGKPQRPRASIKGPRVTGTRRTIVTNNVGRTVVGGLVGTVAMTAVIYGVAPMMGVHMDIAAMLGSMFGGSWAVGLLMHLMIGTVAFPLAYAVLLQGRLPGTDVVRGIQFGIGLWLLAQIVVMPMTGAGVFSANAGGLTAAMGSLVGHLLYGAALGVLAGARRPVPVYV
jgi:hypothetical protein